MLRDGRSRAKVNLYDFLLKGRIENVRCKTATSIVARPRKHTVQVSGEVLNPYVFEFEAT